MSKELGGNGPDGPTAGAPIKPAPIFLRAEDVKAKAREAYMRGALPSVDKLYSGKCAIGIAMSPEQIDFLKKKRVSVYGKKCIADDVRFAVLAETGIVATDNLYFLIQLQWANDLNDYRHMERLLEIEPPQSEGASTDQAGPTGSPKGVAPTSPSSVPALIEGEKK